MNPLPATSFFQRKNESARCYAIFPAEKPFSTRKNHFSDGKTIFPAEKSFRSRYVRVSRWYNIL